MGSRKYLRIDKEAIPAMYQVVLLDKKREPTEKEKREGFEYYLGLGYYVKAMIRKVNYFSNLKVYVWTIVFDKRNKYEK